MGLDEAPRTTVTLACRRSSRSRLRPSSLILFRPLSYNRKFWNRASVCRPKEELIKIKIRSGLTARSTLKGNRVERDYPNAKTHPT